MPMQEKMFDVTGIGEIMLRYSVPAGAKLERARSLDINIGGAEGNLVCALSSLGRKCAWVGALPNNPLGKNVENHLLQSKVDTKAIVWKDGRIGTFYIEFASAPRATNVYYDRADSCAAKLKSSDINWGYLLSSKLLHQTGITPALSKNCLELTKEALTKAKERGIARSFDVNYRQKLWSEKEAAETIKSIAQGVDLFFCGQSDAKKLFGIEGEPEKIVNDILNLSNAKWAVVTLADEGVVAWNGSTLFHAPAYPVQIVDRIGAGDALAAGVIHGFLDGDMEKGLKFGTAMAGICLSLSGDTVITSLSEVEDLIKNTAGSLRR